MSTNPTSTTETRLMVRSLRETSRKVHLVEQVNADGTVLTLCHILLREWAPVADAHPRAVCRSCRTSAMNGGYRGPFDVMPNGML